MNYLYSVLIEADPEEGGFVATVPTLGIATQGETLDETRLMVREAIEGYLEGLKQEGQPIPIEPELESLPIADADCDKLASEQLRGVTSNGIGASCANEGNASSQCQRECVSVEI